MSKLTKILKSPRFFVTLGFVLVVLLVWLVLGMLLGISALICLLTTCVLLLLYIGYLFWDQATASRRAENLERSIWEQSEDQKMGVRPDKREEIENLRQQLAGSIQQLKKSKLAQGKRGSAALYALPWYMIIGPPGAGKTTAIRNSGLEFPFGTDREIQGVGGTRNCDWWFSSSGIILDTAGRYTTAEEDQEEWFAFLDTLKKNRRRQPVNGVLICISIADVAGATADELEFHAKTIRKRLDELTQRLGIQFPVYLVFTKCDLLNGFVEMFGDFSRAQREQVWGCTFTPDQLSDPSPKGVFDKEFDLLSEALVNLRFSRVSPTVKRESRSLIYSFPMEFKSTKENLSYFVGKLFQPNPYQETPVFRGFYFTSGTQEGVPIDKVIHSVAQAFGLNVQAAQQFNPEVQTKSYFIKELFEDVIMPGDRFVRLNAKAARRQRWLKAAIVGAGVLGLALIIIGVTQAYFRSSATLEATGAEVESLSKLPYTSGDPYPRLNILLKRIKTLENPPFLTFGMDRSSAAVASLRTLYYRQFTPYAQSTFIRGLEDRLNSRGNTPGETYDDLKAYLLLTKETKRLNEDPAHRSFLQSRLLKLLDPGTAMKAREHIEFVALDFADAVADSLVHPFPADPRAMAGSRVNAGRLDITAIYEQTKKKIANVPPYAFMTNPVLNSKTQVRGLFTREGAGQMEEEIAKVDPSNLGDEAKWVLGSQAEQPAGTVRDQSEIVDSLHAVYFREYANEWWNFLGGIEVLPFDNLSDAANRLGLVADSRNSLIRRLTDDVLKNTKFDTPPGTGLIDREKKKIDRIIGSTATVHPVDRDFRDFHQFVASDPDKGKQGELDALIAQLAQAADELQSLNSQPPREAQKYAQSIFNGGGALPLTLKSVRNSLKTRDEKTRHVIGGLFEQSIRYSWKSVLQRVLVSLNEDWTREVIEPYRQLANYYPFDVSAQGDAPLTGVAEVFSDNGKLAKFMDIELKPFVEEGDQWNGRRWEGDGLELSASARSALLQAKVLRTSLFRGADAGMKVEVRLDPPLKPDDAPDIDKVVVMVGKAEGALRLDEGKPATFSFEWPGEGGAALKLVREHGKTLGLFGSSKDETLEEKSYEGGWGLFRLVGAATKLPSSSRAESRCKWVFKNGIVVTGVMRTDKGFNNPFTRGVSLSLPERLN